MSVPDVNIESFEVGGPTTPGTPVPATVRVNNRETVTPLLGPATCGGAWGSDQGHLTDVTVEVRDDEYGTVVWQETEQVCAPGEQIGNEFDVQFEPTIYDLGSYTVTASTRVVGKDADSDQAGPVGLDVTEDSSSLPDSDSGNNSGGGWPFGDGSGDGNPFDLGFGGSNMKIVLGLVALLAIAWLADSAEGILP
ncbi:hypothetical protein [Halobellus captivus]|uniref:hypothetical protein n=1 Tax=Halobellus captivus TaxID=2592614 RepID=UPI0011A81706|nr:hypothetical protein [Halobellus captivus]